jgi:hypothetical protein
MVRPTEEAEFRAEEWPDDDTAREYAELAEMETLGMPSEETDPSRVAEAREALEEVPEELDLLAELEARESWPLRLAEAETTADRVTRSLEGIDADDAHALAYRRKEAASRALPDDDIARATETSVR